MRTIASRASQPNHERQPSLDAGRSYAAAPAGIASPFSSLGNARIWGSHRSRGLHAERSRGRPKVDFAGRRGAVRLGFKKIPEPLLILGAGAAGVLLHHGS
jgi:hypothetical protein